MYGTSFHRYLFRSDEVDNEMEKKIMQTLEELFWIMKDMGLGLRIWPFITR
jgi:hypothetical protein